MLKHSFFYRLLSCSWILGWLTAYTPETGKDYYAGSVITRASRHLADSLVRGLQPLGAFLSRWGSGSLIGCNLTVIIGALLGIYFMAEVFFGGHGLARRGLYTVIALGVLLLPLAGKKIPRLGQGSKIWSLFRWWIRTD